MTAAAAVKKLRLVRRAPSESGRDIGRAVRMCGIADLLARMLRYYTSRAGLEFLIFPE